MRGAAEADFEYILELHTQRCRLTYMYLRQKRHPVGCDGGAYVNMPGYFNDTCEGRLCEQSVK